MKIAVIVASAAIAYGVYTGYLTPMRAIICVLAGLMFLRTEARELRKAHQLSSSEHDV